MKKTFNINLSYWDGSYIYEKRFEMLIDEKGNKVPGEKYKMVKKKKMIPIEEIRVRPNNDIEIRTITQKDFFKLTKGEVMINCWKVDVLNSAFCNQWNITLPLIKYKEDDEDTQEDEI